MLENGRRFPLDWTSAREFVVHNIGDALAYNRGQISHNDKAGNAYDLIHDTVSSAVEDMQKMLEEVSPIVIIAHSLGATIMSDYIWDHQKEIVENGDRIRANIPTLTGFITFGCSIPLFSLNYEYPEPIQFPGNSFDITHLPSKVARWLNFVDRDDVLGWPLKAFYESNDRLNAR